MRCNLRVLKNNKKIGNNINIKTRVYVRKYFLPEKIFEFTILFYFLLIINELTSFTDV